MALLLPPVLQWETCGLYFTRTQHDEGIKWMCSIKYKWWQLLFTRAGCYIKHLNVCVIVRPSSPINDEASGKDFKFVLIEKENIPLKKETERLVTTKDTGKQFMSAPAPSSTFGMTKWYYCCMSTHILCPVKVGTWCDVLLLLCLAGTYTDDSLKREKQKLSSSSVEEGTDPKCRLKFILISF